MQNCRVCGLHLGYEPWTAADGFPDYGICNCCGTEFGAYDTDLENVRAFRLHWIQEKNAIWSYPALMPKGWDVFEQLKGTLPDWF